MAHNKLIIRIITCFYIFGADSIFDWGLKAKALERLRRKSSFSATKCVKELIYVASLLARCVGGESAEKLIAAIIWGEYMHTLTCPPTHTH